MGTPSLRERKRLRQRQVIEEVAMDLFEARGFEETGVAAIAAAAEVSPRTVYRYFGSKEEIVLAASAEIIVAMRSFLVRRPPSETCFVALRNALFEIAGYFEQHEQRVRRAMRLIRSSPTLQRSVGLRQAEWTAALVEDLGRRPGPAVDELDRRIVLLAFTAVFGAAFETWSDARDAASLTELLAHAFQVLEAQVGSLQDAPQPAP